MKRGFCPKTGPERLGARRGAVGAWGTLNEGVSAKSGGQQRARFPPSHTLIGLPDVQEAAYGSAQDFNRGLEVVGAPHPRAPEEMRKEFCEKADSRDTFESWNSGEWRGRRVGGGQAVSGLGMCGSGAVLVE